MSVAKYLPIQPGDIQPGMRVRAVTTAPAYTATIEGTVYSASERSILIGDSGRYSTLTVADNRVEWHRVIELPEARHAVVLVHQPDGPRQSLIRVGEDAWMGPGSGWTDAEVVAQLDRVLWDGQP